MSGLITVEDYNSALLNYKDVFLYYVDCNYIKDLGFPNNLIIDFFELEKIYESEQIVRYQVTVNSPIWTGGVVNNGMSNITFDYEDFLIYLRPYEENVGRFGVELSLLYNGNIERYKLPNSRFLFKTFFVETHFFMGTPKTFSFDTQGRSDYYQGTKLVLKNSEGETIEITDFTVEERSFVIHRISFDYEDTDELYPIAKIVMNSGSAFFNITQFKNPNFLNITGNLYIGKSNNKLTIQPFISGVKCKLSYLDKEETITLGDTQQVTIDLSQKTDLKDITLKVELAEGPNSNKETLTYKLPVNYQTVNNMATFRDELSNINGGVILRLGSHFTANYDEPIPINHDVIIYGNNKNINLNHGRFIIKEGINVRIQDTNFLNGDTTFLQKDNSTLQLNNCSFTHCTANNNEGLGSCIYCDIDLSSLTIPNDFTTIIQGTTFKDCHGAILHGGELTVSGCDYRLNNSVAMNTHSPYFLYQTDGNATITSSMFDVDLIEEVYDCETLLLSGSVTRYDTNAELINVIRQCRSYLAESDDNAQINDITDVPGLIEDIHFCEDLDNANLAQCLFVCGEDAIINGLSSKELESKVTFFEYNNRSHIFMKYYYPEISACVYISPEPHYEDKSLCYNINNVDYVFRENVQITRADSGNENTNNPFRELI